MLKSLIVRSYWESYGSIQYIERDLGDEFNDVTQDDLAEALGFVECDGFSAGRLMELRRIALSKSLARAVKESGLTKGKFKKLMEKSYGPMILLDSSTVSRSYTVLMSSYLINDVFARRDYGDMTANLDNIRNALTELKRIAILGGHNDDAFNKVLGTVRNLVNKVEVVPGIEPHISEGIFYVPEPLGTLVGEITKKKVKPEDADRFVLDWIYYNVVHNLMFGVSEISSDIFTVFLPYLSCMVVTDLPLAREPDVVFAYHVLVDMVLKSGRTMEKEIEAFGINHVNYWEQYKDHRCIYLSEGDSDVVAVRYDDKDGRTKLSELTIFEFRDVYRTNRILEHVRGDMNE